MFIPHTKDDIRRMLDVIGAGSVDELYSAATGIDPVDPAALQLPDRKDIVRLSGHLARLSARNTLAGAACFCGGGVYNHLVHPAVDQLLARTEFLTAYTPYQSEVSQGTLQFIFEFQTMAASLLGMEVANASMYDGASAAAEAALMAMRLKGREGVLVSSALHPEYRQTIRSYLHAFEERCTEIPFDPRSGATLPSEIQKRLGEGTAAVIVGYPNFFGVIEDLEAAAQVTHAGGALLVSVTAEGVSLGLLEAPGSLGADIAVCEGLSLGLPMSFGGPGVGLFGCRADHVKQMPGRLVGRTVDADGRTAYVLTLAMREQHIRRERATSNICTNHSLCALAVTIHLSLMGPVGLRKQAEICAHRAADLFDRLAATGVLEPVFIGPVFNEKAMKVKGTVPERLILSLAEKGVLLGPALGRWYDTLGDAILVSATECIDDGDMENLCRLLEGPLR
jgi:glycine dehydrogenase subunit 1